WTMAAPIHRHSSFTLIELLVVVAIIAVLAALLLPTLSGARDSAKAAKCQSHLKQLGIALMMYVDDSGGIIPSAQPRCRGDVCPGGPDAYHVTWLGTLYDLAYCRIIGVMICPSDRLQEAPGHAAYTFANASYGYNYHGFGANWYYPPQGAGYDVPFLPMSNVKNPSLTYWVADNADDAAWSGNVLYQNGTVWRHRNGNNILWVDGHVSWLST